jgi:hypothetical protein
MINHFTYLNNGPMVKDFFFKHGGEKFEPFTFGCNHNPTSQKGHQITKKKKSKLDKYLWFAI